jgi:hypothetical protein
MPHADSRRWRRQRLTFGGPRVRVGDVRAEVYGTGLSAHRRARLTAPCSASVQIGARSSDSMTCRLAGMARTSVAGAAWFFMA